MSAFKKGGRNTYMVKIFDRKKEEWVQRGIRTKDSVTAKRMQAMIDAIGAQGKRTWEIVDALVDGVIRVPHLYDIYLEEARDLDRVKVRLEDVDLEPYVKEWLKNPGGKVRKGTDSAKHYEFHVRQMIPKKERFLLARFTSAKIQVHLDELESSAATKRKAAAAISSFSRWLYRRGVIRTKPMRDVELPAAGPPRSNYLETADAIRLADAQPGQYRNFSALLAGSGIEVSVALALTPRDVNAATHEARAAGTKTYTRDRIALIADWAWGYVAQLLKGKHPDARIFDGVTDRWIAADNHRDAVKALVKKGHKVYAGYTMRDARHTWAVRAVKSGMPIEMVARQLGHVDGTLVLKVYGRFIPRLEERQKWEAIATAQDAEHTQRIKEKGK